MSIMLSWMAASADPNGRRSAFPGGGGLLDEELDDELEELGAGAVAACGGRILA